MIYTDIEEIYRKAKKGMRITYYPGNPDYHRNKNKKNIRSEFIKKLKRCNSYDSDCDPCLGMRIITELKLNGCYMYDKSSIISLETNEFFEEEDFML